MPLLLSFDTRHYCCRWITIRADADIFACTLTPRYAAVDAADFRYVMMLQQPLLPQYVDCRHTIFHAIVFAIAATPPYYADDAAATLLMSLLPLLMAAAYVFRCINCQYHTRCCFHHACLLRYDYVFV